MHEVISKDGEIFHIKITESSLGIIYMHLCEKQIIDFKLFKLSFYKYLIRDKFISSRGDAHKISLYDIKSESNKLINQYNNSLKTKLDLSGWDGYLGEENDPMKKKLMRDKKLKNLLKGDMSKLEKYLNSEDE